MSNQEKVGADWLEQSVKKSRVIKFTRYTKDSKNCNRYEEVVEAGQPPILNQLYVQKWFAGDAKAITIQITLD